MEDELELLEHEVAVAEELQEEEVVAQVEDVPEEEEVVAEAGTSPSMSAALWECDRQRALIGSKPSCEDMKKWSERSQMVNFTRTLRRRSPAGASGPSS